MTGNPPISNKTDTIGDEIIWESLLKELDDDLILISRDNTYKDHSTFLKKEYFEKTQKSLIILENISEALTRVGKSPSPKLIEFEKEQLKYQILNPSYMKLEENQNLQILKNLLSDTNIDLPIKDILLDPIYRNLICHTDTINKKI